MRSNNIEVVGYTIELQRKKSGDFISLTDIAKYKTSENPGYIIQNWMRNRNTIRFLGLWERFHNPKFNYLEFEAIEKEAGLNSFVLTPKRWIETTSASFIYSNEADVLNVALFGKTAKMWRDENPDLKGNIRDYASIQQLIVLINLESMNAELIKLGLSQPERAAHLNKMAIEQLTTLSKYDNKFLKNIDNNKSLNAES